MQIIFNINNIRINSWTVNVSKANVTVNYDMLLSNGLIWESNSAIFWATLPANDYDPLGNPIPIPDFWYQLPVNYVQTLTDLTVDARSALMHLIA